MKLNVFEEDINGLSFWPMMLFLLLFFSFSLQKLEKEKQEDKATLSPCLANETVTTDLCQKH